MLSTNQAQIVTATCRFPAYEAVTDLKFPQSEWQAEKITVGNNLDNATIIVL